MADVQPIPDESPRNDRADVFFQTDHLKSELKKRTVRGGAITIVGQAARSVLTGAVSNILLFRLAGLGPDDAGLFALVLSFTGLITLFKDMGLSRATVQKEHITRDETSTLFWINSGIGLAGMLITLALAPLIAWFYGDARLANIALVLAVGFVFSGTAVQHQALLQRQMQFATLATVDLAALILGIGVGAALAFGGFGYWSLVFMQLTTVVANTLGIWIACPWRPSLPRRGTKVGAQLKFGGNLAGFNILNYLQRNVDNLIVGKVSGKVGLGFYSKAYQLLMLPINQINTPMSNVAVPALSRLQKEPDRYRNYYRKAIEMITFVSMPVVALLFVVADDLIRTVLGDGFDPASVIFRLLVPAAFIGTFNVATGWVYTSLGRTDRQLIMALIVSPITIAGFFIGSYWGAAGVAASFSITNVVLRVPTILYCFRGTPLAARDLFAAIARPTVASLGAGAALFFVDKWTDPFLPYAWLRLLVSAGIYGALYVIAWVVLPGGRQFIRESRGLFKELMGKKPKPTNAYDARPASAAGAAAVKLA